jgi:glycosyltransferase involved in cell wall biosynthesis
MSVNNDYPFVSVITPTYNRRRFIPSLIKCYESQDYPKDRMEWIILDDGQEKAEDLFEAIKERIPNIRYIYMEDKLLIGGKRNILNKEAKGEIIVAMDDDDFYFPCRVSAAVKAFKQKPNVELAGASEIYMYYSDNKEIWKLGPYSATHATNGTMAFRSSYAKTHTYDDIVTHSEERSFLDDYKNPMIQLDPMKVMLVMSHSENTFDKKKMREQKQPNPFVKKTTLKLGDFIKDKELFDFFSNA